MPPPPITIATILARYRFRIFWRYVDIMGGLMTTYSITYSKNQKVIIILDGGKLAMLFS